MKCSMRWLSDYVKIDASAQEFASAMTMSGSKVDSYEVEAGEIKGVVVGKVLSVEKHPNADTLVICQMDIGRDKPVQMITGAKNMKVGALAPVALDGAVLHGGVVIKATEMRGEKGEGMLCSLEELGLTKNDFPYAIEDGIFLIEEDCEIGQDIRSAIGLDDTVMDFDITTNRPDCLCVTGLAREAAATFHVPFQLPEPKVKGSGGDINDLLQVEVRNSDYCLRYAAAAVKNVRVGPSPRWMREKLRASGMRPISNIVDITNYVMLELGQPLHAFDLKHVKGGKIIPRNAKPGEKIVTLDGVERTLTEDMLVIADAEEPSAIAGVMGGEYSGIYEDTNTVIIESACFHGPSVRGTSIKLGLRTEASSRYEKGQDPEKCMLGLKRVCELIELLDAGDVVDGVIDVYPNPRPTTEIQLEVEWINRFLGITVPEEEMVAILRELNFEVNGRTVRVPSYRADMENKADLAEEIARIHGFEKIPKTIHRGVCQAEFSPEQRFARTINNTLIEQGFYEIVTYTFYSRKCWDLIRVPENSPLRNAVVIENPLGEDTSIMRTTAIPSMIETLVRNYNNRNPEASLFEIATEFIPVEGELLPNEEKRVVLGQYGPEADFYSLKGAVEALLLRMGIVAEYEPVSDHPTFHPGRCAALVVGGKRIGILGEVHPVVCENYGTKARMYVGHLDFAMLMDAADLERKYTPLPRFPALTRDLALVCEESLPVRSIEKSIAASVGEVLEQIQLFDVYRGEQVGEGKKSVAYSLTLRSDERTLTDQEADAAVETALANLQKLGVELR